MSPAEPRMKMSEYEIPFHIQEEIMKRLPVKSLIQFRSVSKAWKSLIDSSQFIAAHHTQKQHLLVSYVDQQYTLRYVCYIDDDTFPRQRSLPTPLSPTQINRPKVVGSSRGLLCVRVWDHTSKTQTTLLWNLSIRKYIVVVVPPKLNVVGFGVCPVTNDPKIVSITQSSRSVPEARYKCKVTVYTLSSGKWRSPSTNLPTKRIGDSFCTVVTDGFIYWHGGSCTHNWIMSFDVTNESFEVIDLPDTLARHDRGDLRITKLRESLAMLEYTGDICIVWMMEYGAQRSFTKLFTIMTSYHNIVGFRKNGVPIMKVIEYVDDNGDDELYKLVVYEPNSQHRNVIGISRLHLYLDMSSYTETLLLLGRGDCISY